MGPGSMENCQVDEGMVEVRPVDSSSSILLSQDRFGYLRFFVFPYIRDPPCVSTVSCIGRRISFTTDPLGKPNYKV